MTPDQLISDVLAHFLNEGRWPLVRILQREYGPRESVRAIAATAGRDRVVCQEGPDAICFLTLKCMAGLPEAAPCLKQLVGAIRFIAGRFEAQGTVRVTHDEIGAALNLSPLELMRVGALLRQVSRLWVGGGWGSDGSSFEVTPSEEAGFFRDIESFDDFQKARERIDQNEQAITAAMAAEYRARHTDAVLPQAPADVSEYHLVSPELDALLQKDLAELSTVHSLGAWKATAILAGACLETVLLDICKCHDAECSAKWKGNWPSGVGAHDMATFASSNGWIRKDHADMSSVLRRWRNTVHPAAALREQEPTKELADALAAFLRLLLADLQRPVTGAQTK